MPTRKSPRKGSLQFWPRKRAKKFLPRVNWNAFSSSKILKGFIGYKAGMTSVLVKDNTKDSLTNGKDIVVPATFIECPNMKIFSIRFYKNKKVIGEILNSNLDKELKKKVKVPKDYNKKVDDVKEEFDDVKIIFYSLVKKTGIKKTPDLCEVGLNGSVDEKINFVKENLNKEVSVLDLFETNSLVDVSGLTKGKGLVGPVKRFGIKLKFHKSEKGRRRPGSLGPWHPARVTFRVPMAGQLGMFTRTVYNNNIIDIGSSDKMQKELKKYGKIKTNYILIKGSVQGSNKRQLIISAPLRPTKKQIKTKYELVEILK